MVREKDCSCEAKEFWWRYLMNKATFGGKGTGKIFKSNYPSLQFFTKIFNWLPFYGEKLRSAIVKNESWEIIIEEHKNNVNAFFFLDPPYEGQAKFYDGIEKKCPPIDYENMAKMLSEIKGKFLMTINDSKMIRNTFRQFHLTQTYDVNYSVNGATQKKELFISNYLINSIDKELVPRQLDNEFSANDDVSVIHLGWK